jgi:hypothetical protein
MSDLNMAPSAGQILNAPPLGAAVLNAAPAAPAAGGAAPVAGGAVPGAPGAPAAPNPEIEYHIETIMQCRGCDRAAAIGELAKDGIAIPAEPAKADPIHASLKALGETIPAPNAYIGALPYLGDVPPAEAAKIQGTASSWFHAAGLGVGAAKLIANEADGFSKQWAAMTPAGRELAETEATQRLRAALGARYEPALQAARAMLHAVDDKTGGQLLPTLERSGILNHPLILAQIVLHGERIAAGGAGRDK